MSWPADKYSYKNIQLTFTLAKEKHQIFKFEKLEQSLDKELS